MLCVPPLKALVVQAAVRLLPLPAKATAEQPLIVLPPSVKATDPVGAVPLTVAVKVTFAPTVDGLSELASVVVLAAAPPTVTLTVSALEVAPSTITFTP